MKFEEIMNYNEMTDKHFIEYLSNVQWKGFKAVGTALKAMDIYLSDPETNNWYKHNANEWKLRPATDEEIDRFVEQYARDHNLK